MPKVGMNKVCKACNGTGKNSKGGECVPCTKQKPIKKTRKLDPVIQPDEIARYVRKELFESY